MSRKPQVYHLLNVMLVLRMVLSPFQSMAVPVPGVPALPAVESAHTPAALENSQSPSSPLENLTAEATGVSVPLRMISGLGAVISMAFFSGGTQILTAAADNQRGVVAIRELALEGVSSWPGADTQQQVASSRATTLTPDVLAIPSDSELDGLRQGAASPATWWPVGGQEAAHLSSGVSPRPAVPTLTQPPIEPDDKPGRESAYPLTTLLRQTAQNPQSAVPLSYGQTVTGTIATPGHVVTYTFTASAGDVVLVGMSDDDYYFDPEIRLYAPDGSLLNSAWSSGSHAEFTQTLSLSGTHTILAGDNVGDDTADYGVFLQRLNNPGTATLLPFGQTAPGNISLLAEMHTYTFTARAGDVVLVGMSDDDYYFDPEIRLYAPDGSLLNSAWSSGSRAEFTQTFSLSGTHTVLAGDNVGDDTADYGVFLQRLNDPGTATLLPFGQTAPGTISLLAEMHTYAFTASAGDVVLVGMSDDDYYFDPEIRLYAPDGSLLNSNWSSTYHAEFTQTLSLSGTHTVLAGDNLGNESGDYGVYVQRVNNPVAPFLPIGEPQDVSVTPGMPLWFQIEVPGGATNLLVTLQKYSSWSSELKLYRGTGVLASTSGSADQILRLSSLVSGTYLLEVSGSGSGLLAAYIAPRVVGHTPSSVVVGTLQSVQFSFSHPMDETSFSPSEDVQAFSGPAGPLTVTGYSWIGAHTLEVTFDPQSTPGTYELVIGPEITCQAGSAMDQDGDCVLGEDPDDRYGATFLVSLSGRIEEDTTLYPSTQPLVLDGSLTVVSGVTLTIEAGTIVKFTGSALLDIQGRLDIRGTSSRPVILTSWRDDSAGGDTNGDGGASQPAAGDWRGVRFSAATATGTLANVQIRYADKAVHGNASGASVELHNAILRNGEFGVYVYTPYVEIDAENCLIVDNAYTGIFVRASSAHEFRNCTIVGNGFQGSGRNGAGVHLGAATLTLDNCIVAFNANGLHHSGDPPSVVVRNSDFYNPADQEIIWDGDPGMPDLNENDNITTDPLFVDQAADDYELSATSPCIDSGRGIGAPTEDILSRSRYDDLGMPNTGSGYPSYVDRGAFERQADTAAGDVAVTYMSGPEPETVSSGDIFTVEYTIANAGLLDCIGPWQDTMYLSDDPYISPDDQILATRTYSGTLIPGDSYDCNVAATAPSTSGPRFIIVHANSAQAFLEADETNNVANSPNVLAIGVPLLELDTPVAGMLAPDEWIFYRFEGPPGDSVRFNLDADAASGSTGLYVRHSLPPTTNEYDAAATVPDQPDQEAKLLQPLDGTYYIGIHGQYLPGGPTNYTLSAELTELGITSVSPNTVGDIGNATIKIVGDNFSPDDEVYLLAPDDVTQLPPSEVHYVDPSQVFATFNFAGVDLGTYDAVIVTAESEVATLADVVEVVADGNADFQATISMPGMTRPGRIINVRIDYSNTGTNDIPSPILTLDSDVDDVEWRLPWHDEWMVGPDFRVMTPSSEGPLTVLRPGQTESIVVKMRIPLRPEDITVELFSLGAVPTDGSLTPIDWNALKNEKRPESMPADAWEAIWANFTDQVGDTWGDYVSMLNENVNYLGSIGQDTDEVSLLLAFEMQQASAIGPYTYLLGDVDAFVPAPSLPLAFSRVYGQPIDSRYELGPLGRGWKHIWDIYAEELSEGDVIIHGPNGADRYFTKDDSSYTASPGDYGTLTTSGGSYRLTEKYGTVWQFCSDNLLDYVEDTNGNRITAGYDARQLISLTHSNGDQLLLDHNANGRIWHVTDSRGAGPEDDHVTTFEYDTSGEYLLSVTAPGNRVITYTYETAGTLQQRHALLSVEYPDATHSYFTYDDHGRLIQTHRDGGAEAVTYSYDSAGTVTLEDATSQQSRLYFGLGGQLAQARDGEGNIIGLAYDDNYQLTGLTGPSGQQYGYSYDPQGNVIGIEDPVRQTTAFAYEPSFNDLGSVTDARGNGVENDYDAWGNLASITYEDSTSESFTYDASGNVLTWTNRRGDTVTYTYNAAGQLTSKDYPSTPGVADYAYDYDDASNLISATDANGTTSMTYDPDTDWLERIDYPGGQFFTFEYDDAGRRTRRTDQDGNVVNYTYDGIGRLDQMTDTADDLIVDYDYDAAGRLALKTLGNDTYTTYQYDDAGRLLHLVNYDPTDAVLSRFDYTYDASGRRTSMTTRDGTYTYGYDPLGQLISVTYPDGHSVEYVYDAVGNRIEVIDDGASTVYTTNEMNQYTDVGGITYTYDDDGSMVTTTKGGVTTTYTYDIGNRLIGVTTPTDIWTYTYDALGNRIVSDYNGVTTNYIVDPIGLGNVAAEYDGGGTLIARYDYGFGLLSRTDSGGGSAYYTFDATGSTSELVDQDGAVLSSYTYDPFGTILSEMETRKKRGEAETVANPFKYGGQIGIVYEDDGRMWRGSMDYLSDTASSVGEGIKFSGNTFSQSELGLRMMIQSTPNLVRKAVSKGWLTSKDLRQLKNINKWSGRVGWTMSVVDYWGKSRSWAAGELSTWDLAVSGGNTVLDTAMLVPVSFAPHVAAARLGWKVGWGIGSWIDRTFPENWISQGFYKVGLWWYSRGQPWLNPRTDPAGSCGESHTNVRTSYTPEDKFGSAGYDAPDTPAGSEVRYISASKASQAFDYRIEFWNKEDAPVPTQDAIIEDVLDPSIFDLSTFAFTRIGFLKWDVPLPGGQVIDTRVDLRPEMNLAVDVTATFDPETGKIRWWFHCVDPLTGDYPEDPMAGFLPPYNPETGFEIGWVEFTVEPKAGLSSGTQITNQAFVEFDFAGDLYDHPAPKEGPWVNTIDTEPPESQVDPLPATSGPHFQVSWHGADETGGSGIASYDVYVSTDGGEYVVWLEDTTETSAVFAGDCGHTYAFYSIARDNVGHAEPAPATPDTQTDVMYGIFLPLVTRRYVQPPVGTAIPVSSIR